MKRILDNIKNKIEVEKPFVVYKKPNGKELHAFFQENDKVYITKNYNEDGFVFAPFDDKKNTVLMPAKFSEYVKEDFLPEKCVLNSVFSSDKDAKCFHIKLVDKGIEAIHKNVFKKVVLSRKETVSKENIDIIDVFKKLLNTYNNAFVYIWYHPKVGFWMGATPETLLKIEGNTFETMSLAGTQVYKEDEKVVWKTKEIEEQGLVTDYVLEKLSLVSKSVKAFAVETVKAGNLLHLKTKITGNLGENPSSLINILHPTPAVCGFPKRESKEFILKHENYDRKFYTGFLGELNLPNSELFVNLRCMEIEKKNVHIYVGGGITKDSIPEKEWIETVVKTKTMKRVF